MPEREPMTFPLDEYEARLSAVRRRLAARELDAMLVTTPENVCYLSGFETAGHFAFLALLVPLAGEAICVARALECPGVAALTGLQRIVPYADVDDPMRVLADIAGAAGLAGRRVGFERSCWFFTAAQQDRLLRYAEAIDWHDASLLVEQERVVKSEREIALMREAGVATTAGMLAGIGTVGVGVSEDEVAAQMHLAMIRAGSEWPAIAPFVAAGERGAIGHATWRGRSLRRGEPVFLELAGCRRRYHAAQLRTVFVGEPDAAARAAFAVVQEAYAAAAEAVRPGVSAGEVDRVARAVIAASPFGAVQSSRSGYSMGIALSPDWGEGHILSMKVGEGRVLEPNMTFHLLPWVQLPGVGGVGCSETIRVTASGCEPLTHGVSRDLLVA